MPGSHSTAFRRGLSTADRTSRALLACGLRGIFQLTPFERRRSNTRLFRGWESVDETHLSTLEDASHPHAWLSSTAQDARRTGGAARAARKGKGSPRSVNDDCRLPRTARLSDDKAIEGFRSAARLQRGRWFVVRWVRNAVGYPRLAVRVGKRAVKTAVARNRIRRLVRETFRSRRAALPADDFLVSVRADVTGVTMAEARQDLERLLLRA